MLKSEIIIVFDSHIDVCEKCSHWKAMWWGGEGYPCQTGFKLNEQILNYSGDIN